MPHETFVGYDQTIANGVGPTSLELVLPQVCVKMNNSAHGKIMSTHGNFSVKMNNSARNKK
jgi:hypothetical protein